MELLTQSSLYLLAGLGSLIVALSGLIALALTYHFIKERSIRGKSLGFSKEMRSHVLDMKNAFRDIPEAIFFMDHIMTYLDYKVDKTPVPNGHQLQPAKEKIIFVKSMQEFRAAMLQEQSRRNNPTPPQ